MRPTTGRLVWAGALALASMIVATAAQVRAAEAPRGPASVQAATTGPPADAQVPAHPRDLKYPALTFEPPDAAKHRRVLKNKVPAYMVEDHDLPLVTVTVMARTGSYLDPTGKEGLASAVASQMRAGGAGKYTAEQFDEEADFLAATLSASIAGTMGTFSANFLAKDTDKALDLFFDMLRAPAFQQDRLDLFKTQTLQGLERRNDNTAGIEGREWGRLMYGDNHFSTTPMTKASVEAMTRDDLVAFHKAWIHPASVIVAVSGDFKPEEMAARLEARMAGWTGPAKFAAPPVPRPTHVPVPGVYMVHKTDVNQGRVTMGHLGIQRGNPDEVAVEMMNDVLGGSGFTSRITNRVRSDEGLAYSAGSTFPPGTYYPGAFRAGFQSKSSTVAQAIQIVLEEIDRIRTQKVSAEELETVKNSAIEVFPRQFSSAGAIATLFASDEFTGRDPKYWKTYRDRVRAVTLDEVQRVAQKYLQPDKIVILAVGNADDMLKGNPDKPQYSFDAVRKGASITRIPLPDPMTMVYPKP
jgi:predicted Zn-dependent peptidase